MPTLYVRDMPEELYARLKERAAKERRSVSQEAISLLEWALSEVEMEEALTHLIRRRSPRKLSIPSPSRGSTKLTPGGGPRR
ncbi:MAG: hypothetical protein HY347_01540 [candidate division NC10 bacterium]|nr:hypothetical protein [candidate division NC10 bacterium]